MNVYELDTLSLQYIRRPVDNEARTELSAFFLTAYNEVYRRIMTDAYRLFAKETVRLDSDHEFNTDSLNNELLGIRKITSLSGERLLWERNVGNIISVRTSAQNVVITYNYMPALLVNQNPIVSLTVSTATNMPVIPKEYHNVFSLWAAYRYLHSRRKFEDSSCYYEMATELISKIKNDVSEKIKLKVNYMN